MPLAIEIREDDLTGQAIAALLREHLEGMAQASPPESIHALDLPSLRAPEVTFWSAWRGPELVGCGALKELDAQHGEIKSMRTVPAYLRQGVGGPMYVLAWKPDRWRRLHRPARCMRSLISSTVRHSATMSRIRTASL